MIYNPDNTDNQYLDINFANKSKSFKKIGDFKTISTNMQIACCIMKEIERAEIRILQQT